MQKEPIRNDILAFVTSFREVSELVAALPISEYDKEQLGIAVENYGIAMQDFGSEESESIEEKEREDRKAEKALHIARREKEISPFDFTIEAEKYDIDLIEK